MSPLHTSRGLRHWSWFPQALVDHAWPPRVVTRLTLPSSSSERSFPAAVATSAVATSPRLPDRRSVPDRRSPRSPRAPEGNWQEAILSVLEEEPVRRERDTLERAPGQLFRAVRSAESFFPHLFTLCTSGLRFCGPPGR